MSHPRFEDWIFSRASLSGEQQQALEVHLAGCPACAQLHAAMNAAEDALAHSPFVEPAPGFLNRWQAKLARERAARGARQVYLALGLVGAAILGMTGLLGLSGWELISSPAQVANQLLFNLNLALESARGIPTLVRIVLNLADGLHLGWAMMFSAAVGGMGVLWSYLTYRMALQEVQNGGFA
jgi:anti-sigma factor RsiW